MLRIVNTSFLSFARTLPRRSLSKSFCTSSAPSSSATPFAEKPADSQPTSSAANATSKPPDSGGTNSTSALQDPLHILQTVLPALTEAQFGEFCELFPLLSPSKGKVQVAIDATGRPYVVNQKGANVAHQLVERITKMLSELTELLPSLAPKFASIVSRNPDFCRLKSLRKSIARVEDLFGVESSGIISTYPRVLLLAVAASGHASTSPTKLEEKLGSLSDGLGHDEALELICKDPLVLSKNAERTTSTRVDLLESVLKIPREQVVRVIQAIPELLYCRQNRIERLRCTLPPMFGAGSTAGGSATRTELVNAEVSPDFIKAVTDLLRTNQSALEARGGLPPPDLERAAPAPSPPPKAKPKVKATPVKQNVILYPEDAGIDMTSASSSPSSASAADSAPLSPSLNPPSFFSSPEFLSSSSPVHIPSSLAPPSTEQPSAESQQKHKRDDAQSIQDPTVESKPSEFYVPTLPSRSNKQEFQTLAWIPSHTAHNRRLRIEADAQIRAEEEAREKERKREEEILGILEDSSSAEINRDGRKSNAVGSVKGQRELSSVKAAYNPALWRQDPTDNVDEESENKVPRPTRRHTPKHRGKRKPTLPPWWKKPRREGGNKRLLRGAIRKAHREKLQAQRPKTVRRRWTPS